jgi:hypothetical protein
MMGRIAGAAGMSEPEKTEEKHVDRQKDIAISNRPLKIYPYKRGHAMSSKIKFPT